MRAIPIYLADGRCVGRIVGNTYHTTRRRSVHLLRQPPSWAIDVSILRELEARGVERVIISETEEGSTYEADLTAFRKHGMRFDRGHGEQVALPLGYWRVDADRRDDRPAQLALELGGAA